jgi:hypothetical protein
VDEILTFSYALRVTSFQEEQSPTCGTRRSPAPVRHPPEPVSRLPDPARRSPEAASRSPEAVSRPPEAVSRPPEAVSRSPEAVSRSPEAVSRSPEAASRSPEAVSRPPEAVSRSPEAVSRSPEAVSRSPEAASRSPEAASRSPEALNRLSEALNRLSESVSRPPEAVKRPPEVVKRSPAAVSRRPEPARRPPEPISRPPEVVSSLLIPADLPASSSRNCDRLDETQRQAKGPQLPDEFDVFLSHNSLDKPVVEKIAVHLRDRGLRVWLDKDELRPGLPWQEGLEDGVRASRSVAVFVGKDGMGAWQQPEMRAFLARSRQERIPVIPVLLPGCPDSPQLTLFLEAMTWVDLRQGMTDDGLDRLVCQPQEGENHNPKAPEGRRQFRRRCCRPYGACRFSRIASWGWRPRLHA